MTKTQAPLRYYIDRDQDHAVVRAVAIARATSPAIHRVETPPAPTPALPVEDAETTRRRARMGKLVQQAIRRRHR
jgi:hypothetical protein